MAPWSRKQGRSAERASAEAGPAGSVRLDGDDHAWWAREEVATVWRPGSTTTPAPERDILAEHLGEDWRTRFGFTPAEDADDEPRAPDPYDVLEVAPTATWAEIVAAHRRQARIHHPDQLFGQPTEGMAEERPRGEERIRAINAAYQELRIRRGR